MLLTETNIWNFFLKNWRMRVLSARIFLSLLAGKLNDFQQMLLTETNIWKIVLKKRRIRILSAPNLSKSFDRKIKNLKTDVCGNDHDEKSVALL